MRKLELMKKLPVIAGLVIACAVAGVLGFRYVSERGPNPGSFPKKPLVDVAALSAKAEAGDAEAQVLLGQFYVKGEGVTNSYAEAAKWFSLAAGQTNSGGLLALGELYEAG